MRKKILLTFIIATLTSCSFFQLRCDKELTEKINSKYLKEKKSIDLTKITTFNWDSYIVIGCYEDVEQVGKRYNIDLANISENGISSSDWFILLVFIKNKKSIKICEVKIDTKFTANKLLKENLEGN